jgi:outer membrane protein
MILTGMACLLSSYPVCAQDSTRAITVTSFTHLWDQVRKDNPTQRVYALNVQKAKIDHSTSRSFLYPAVGGSFNGQDNLHLAVTPVPGELIGQPGTTFNVQFGKHYTYGTGLSATENVFNWTAVFDARITANAVVLNQAQAASYEQTLKEQTAHDYYALLVASAAMDVAREDHELADSLVSFASRRLAEGLSDVSALNLARIDAGNVKVNLAQSRLLYEQAMENLCLLLGRRTGDSLLVMETLDIRAEPAAAIFALGPDRNLDVYRLQWESAALEHRQRQTVFYPTLALDGYYGVQQFRDDFGLSFKPGAWNNYSYIGLSLNLPLFTGFSNLGRWKSAGLSEQVAALQYDNARLQSQNGDVLLQRQYKEYLEMTRVSREGFLLYGHNLELARQKFSEGLLAMDGYLKVFEDYLGSENGYLNNISNLLSTQAAILARN